MTKNNIRACLMVKPYQRQATLETVWSLPSDPDQVIENSTAV